MSILELTMVSKVYLQDRNYLKEDVYIIGGFTIAIQHRL